MQLVCLLFNDYLGESLILNIFGCVVGFVCVDILWPF